ncbi:MULTISPECIES: ABC transporter permease subunit [Xanthomonas translucens group]|uniref:Putrescine transport system permease protein PotH n=1 Tax=Xanthomonas graminis pv. poae TaxID=227946 RepID=A0A0K3A3Y2_9XANT|nr:ABC transporter permease subunit [Xanthomonas translucens]KTF39264.1 spermidine/putrescine ABC transporter permease [Xanthomonas translucens pv. translucens]KWV13294.1 spermidine/putrescine ABC transporter permease [Xanthomonas translucens]MCS3359305.1 ABC transporter permease subunit [Xanthomonas translucens pv. translucens]MCS3372573.1 ABC transporter permease subunit [Xanthomonas translucens pv. translucens]MCT8273423.1 ABC transporter permease subunit [Xanthomonas translucens pv. transl
MSAPAAAAAPAAPPPRTLLQRLRQRRLPGARWLVIAAPYLWLLLFFAIPFLIVLRISFAEQAISSPPYSALVDYQDGVLTLKFTLQNYLALVRDNQYIEAYWGSIKIAGISTLLTLLIGYPMAYVIARLSPSARNIAMMLVVLPSWTSFLIRVYAWIGILDSNGVLNRALLALGLIEQPLRILYTPIAAYIGIVYCYLPFMVLPLYATLVKQDHRLLEAAYDLGARPWKAFATITLPMSRPGIVAGCMLVMIPAVGEFVIPEMLGGPDTLMIGRVLWGEFFNNRDWPAASAVAIAMLALLMLPILIFNRYQQRQLAGGQA